MAISFSRPDPSSPAAVADAAFSTGRRGFDQQEVRDFLRMVAAELARLQERERFLERELRDVQERSPHSATLIDDETATRLLGEEATRILQTAREGGNAIRSKAEEGAARLLREAADDAQRQREEADLEASRRRTDAAADAEAELAMARQQGREMVEEARAYRERVLSELSRRRELARQQLEQLIHGRDRLLQAFERARLVAVDVVAEMAPAGEPDEYVDLSPTTGPVPIMVASSSIGDDSSIDDSLLADSLLAESVSADDVHMFDQEDQEEAAPVDGPVEDGADILTFPAPAEPAEETDPVESPDEIDDDDVTATDVDELFARLRSGREPPQVLVDSPPEPVTDVDEPPDSDDAAGEEESPFRRRDAVLVPLIVAAARKLKRALADEQNEALDALRRKEPVVDVADLVPAPAEHATRYSDAVTDELIAAAEAGAASISGEASIDATGAAGPTGPLEAVRQELTTGLVEPLRARLADAVAGGDGDNDVVAKRVRSVYREWKVQRIGGQLDDLFRLAYVRGSVDAMAPGTPVRWIVDPDGPPSPDGEDNTLAGPTPLGEPFPSGHLWPPMHPGCRGLLILADG